MCGWGKRLLCVVGGIGYCVCGGVRGYIVVLCGCVGNSVRVCGLWVGREEVTV